ncbi:ShlB/FhaC/HecB family hemolysin secretion/activation protein [Pseudomonas schmalbachii]|nr:ShlB/FhaC/HecB family hemolysin secretion/activation protein [Pseudomonas schmalbachii]
MKLNRLSAAVMLCSGLLLGLLPGVSSAAGVAPPPRLDPGRMEIPGADGQRGLPSDMTGLPSRPGATEVQIPETEPSTTPQPAASSTRFFVSKVNLEGVTVYPPTVFAELQKYLEGRQVSLAEVNDVVARINRRYRKDGYLLVRAFVPAQKVQNGQLTIKVIEGKVNDVRFNEKPNRAQQAYADNIRKEVPIKAKTLERNMLLMNDLSGYDAKGVLSPSQGLEGTDLSVTNELRKVEGFVGFDNRDSRFFGPWQVYGGVGVNDPFGLGDNLSLRLGRSVESDKMSFVEGQYDVPVGNDGAILSLLGQHNEGNADTIVPLNANSSGDTLAARVTYPWIRSRSETLKTSIGFTWFNGKAEYLDDPDQPPSSDDRIRAVRLGASYDFADKYGGRNLFKAELSKGLDIMGASAEDRSNPSRYGGETDFTKLQFDAQRIQDMSAIVENMNLYLAITGQTAFGNALLSPEQFGVGGSQFGRGYDPSEITGDNGLAGKVELQYNHLHNFMDQEMPTQYYGYWDIGKVWNNEPRDIDSESLASAGLGIHFNVMKDMYISPEIAFPLTRTVSAEELDGDNGKEPRLYINFLKLF